MCYLFLFRLWSFQRRTSLCPRSMRNSSPGLLPWPLYCSVWDTIWNIETHKDDYSSSSGRLPVWNVGRACFKKNLSLHISSAELIYKKVTFFTLKHFYLSIKISDDLFSNDAIYPSKIFKWPVLVVHLTFYSYIHIPVFYFFVVHHYKNSLSSLHNYFRSSLHIFVHHCTICTSLRVKQDMDVGQWTVLQKPSIYPSNFSVDLFPNDAIYPSKICKWPFLVVLHLTFYSCIPVFVTRYMKMYHKSAYGFARNRAQRLRGISYQIGAIGIFSRRQA